MPRVGLSNMHANGVVLCTRTGYAKICSAGVPLEMLKPLGNEVGGINLQTLCVLLYA